VLDAPEEVETPGVTTCEALADFLGIDVAATTKAMPVAKADGTVVLALVRGDDRLSEMKLYDALPGESRPATDEEIRAAFGAGGGSLGPVGFQGEVIADPTLRSGQFVSGANRDGWHLRGVEAGRDYEPRFADLREPKEGDRCHVCGGALQFQTAVEVGHIFNFGSFYSTPLEAMFLDEDGREKPLLGGSYGIGPGRVMAAIVEQHHDENGIIWPAELAPYDCHVVVLKGAEEIGERAAATLGAAGLDVLLDDRDLRPGEKFADADLIGCPTRITAGKKSLEDGKVDARDRATGEESRLDVAELGKKVGDGAA
jgi:prolyl-tRNA synthetase